MASLLQKEVVQKDIVQTELQRLHKLLPKVEQAALLLKLTGHQQGLTHQADQATAHPLIITKVVAVQVVAEAKEAEAEINLTRTII